MDPPLPMPGERRFDSGGMEWVWGPTHHTVAEELEIQASNGDYWDKRLEVNSADAEKRARGEEFVVDEQVENSAFAQPAYKWYPVQ
jgi:hypothetical protein